VVPLNGVGIRDRVCGPGGDGGSGLLRYELVAIAGILDGAAEPYECALMRLEVA